MTKKLIFIFISAFFLSAPQIFAQYKESVQKILCSVRAEPVLSLGYTGVSADDSDIFDYSGRPSVLFGVNFPFKISDNLTMIPGLAFETKGSVYEYRYSENEFFTSAVSFMNGNNLSAASLNLSLFKTLERRSFISVPIQLAITPFSNGLENLNLIIGLNTSMLLGSASRFDDVDRGSWEKNNKDVRGLNIGALFGVRYDFENRIGLGLIYDHGINNWSTSEFVSLRDRTVRLMVAYRLPFNPIFRESYTREGREKIIIR
jgi:hypothetical protein